jgi:hypothetical protein
VISLGWQQMKLAQTKALALADARVEASCQKLRLFSDAKM